VKRIPPVLVALSGSLLLWAAWPVSPLTLLIFVAWIPQLWLSTQATSWKKLLWLTWLQMVGWNVLTTWWIWNASLPGAFGAFFVNSLVMCVPWMLFYATRQKWGGRIAYPALVVCWLAFEFLHHNWELSWPWLTLGNVFATHPEWVQWYQYTGTSGGTTWVLVTNILAFTLFQRFQQEGRSAAYRINLISLVLILAVPLLSSRFIAINEQKLAAADLAQSTRNVVVVQPNIDPYTEKFTGEVEAQIQKLIVLSEKQIDKFTSLVVWPETAIPAQVREDQLKEDFRYRAVWSFLLRHQRISLLTGIDSYREYGKNKKDASATARLHAPSGIYYDLFNTAVFMEPDSSYQLYHKAKLVPGVETLPSFLGFMGSWFEDFGGISGTLGRDSERKVFVPWDEYFKSAPIICYESIYSDYITEYVRKGANLLTIITNDGWWGNTPGYKQHMNYARLRAIETRLWIARSANTGISCFIDPLGNVLQPQPWDTATAIKMTLPATNRITFYVRYGDLLSRAATVLALLLLVCLAGKAIMDWRKKRQTAADTIASKK
jgi:apolipoprotein N-acyltransferase